MELFFSDKRWIVYLERKLLLDREIAAGYYPGPVLPPSADTDPLETPEAMS